ncbi:cytochrome c oxidase subunit 4 [Allokutzneria albata]|uniref:Cytochrome c oxidase polypeptide 4 n=1 Tax=Allokutzneria albata TaxID=211114 RepID=A0A1H0CPE8_ALLAB|nr:cytochrome c oxidase subunit 4 [Allokutzneria albata]SDN59759.1 Cytochrome c oxidase subunit IV [Allokutzneria albata]
MRTEARIFDLVTAFCLVAAIGYGVWSHEPVGTVAISLTGGLTLIVGTYLRFVARRIEQRPEDNVDAEVSDGAGELGFFSPGSYWPFGLALAAAFTGVSLAFFEPWMIGIGVVVVLIMVAGLLFEYHVGPDHH